jgi:hypothetical protein
MSIYSSTDQYRFYVYFWIRSKTSVTGLAGTPYYVGKGSSKRAYRKGGPRNKKYVVLIETNLSEVGAFALERRYIRWYGRKDLGTGILHNQTDGGDGITGVVRSKEWRESHSAKVSVSMTGRVVSAETRLKISEAQKGKPRKNHSDETKAKMSLAQQNRAPDSDETRQKKSMASMRNIPSTKGKKMSEEQKAKLRKPKKPRTPEHIAKLGAAVKLAAQRKRDLINQLP